jgi:hypothetical protein
MSSDNRFEQVEALVEADERQELLKPVETILKGVEKVLPVAGPLITAIRYESEKRKAENIELMRSVVWEELKRVSAVVDDYGRDPERLTRLTLDAVQKAEDLRDVERVKRIGRILAHAITLGPMSDLDKAEEMMRVARDLSDQDVLALRQIYDSQFAALNGNGWDLDVHQVNVLWKEKKPSVPGTVLPGELASIFLKLQGLGLVTSVERMNTQHGPNEQVFSLLPKGGDFVRYIEGAVGSQ